MAEVTRVTDGGRIVIPAAFRRALGLKVGDEVIVQLEDDAVRVLTLRQAVERAQAIVRRRIPQERSLARELIADRRTEADRE